MVKLKIDFSRFNLSVPVNIWDKNENRFREVVALFDTGAHTCSIDAEVFLNLGYNFDGAIKSAISTATRPHEVVNRVIVDKIKLEDMEINSVLFNTFEFPLSSRSIILGMNIIRHFEVNMNFKKRLITMHENYDDDGGHYIADIFGDWRADSEIGSTNMEDIL